MRRQLLTAKTNWLLENSVGAPDWETVDESSLVTLKAESSSELLKNPGSDIAVQLLHTEYHSRREELEGGNASDL